jgi:hypothetical protein
MDKFSVKGGQVFGQRWTRFRSKVNKVSVKGEQNCDQKDGIILTNSTATQAKISTKASNRCSNMLQFSIVQAIFRTSFEKFSDPSLPKNATAQI